MEGIPYNPPFDTNVLFFMEQQIDLYHYTLQKWLSMDFTHIWLISWSKHKMPVIS